MAHVISRQRSDEGRIWRAWLIAWLGGSVLGIVNGVVRELVYKDEVGDRTAHYISTATLIVLLALYFLDARQKVAAVGVPRRASDRARLGTSDGLLRLRLRHYVDRKPWSELARDYDLSAGRVWILVLAWVALGPSAVRGIRRTMSRQP
jgi:hypothetical protein